MMTKMVFLAHTCTDLTPTTSLFQDSFDFMNRKLQETLPSVLVRGDAKNTGVYTDISYKKRDRTVEKK